MICIFLAILIITAAIIDWQLIKNIGEKNDDPEHFRMSDIPQEMCINPESKWV